MFVKQNSAVLEEARERGPTFEHIVDRLGDLGVTGELGPLDAHPAFESLDQSGDALLPHAQALSCAQADDVALDIEDCVGAVAAPLTKHGGGRDTTEHYWR